MRHGRAGSLRVAVLASVAAVVLAACLAPTGPTAAVDGQPRATQPDCYSMNETIDRPPDSIANLVPYTDRVIVATVVRLGDGFWNTPDRKPPPPDRISGPEYDPGILTPALVRIDGVVRGDLGPGDVEVVIEGGVVGCIEHTVSPRPSLTAGRRYAMFLQPSPRADLTRDAALPLVLAAWPVGDDGTVTTDQDGILDEPAFRRLVERAASDS
jgi:hypothetical protein